MKGNCVFRGEFLYPYIPGLGMVGSLAWLPWHKVSIHLLSLTCRETCCSHCALTYFPNIFPAPLREPSCRSAGLYTSSYLHLGPASTFPLSEGQMHPHTAFKYLTHTSSNPPSSEKLRGGPQRSFLLQGPGPLSAPDELTFLSFSNWRCSVLSMTSDVWDLVSSLS